MRWASRGQHEAQLPRSPVLHVAAEWLHTCCDCTDGKRGLHVSVRVGLQGLHDFNPVCVSTETTKARRSARRWGKTRNTRASRSRVRSAKKMLVGWYPMQRQRAIYARHLLFKTNYLCTFKTVSATMEQRKCNAAKVMWQEDSRNPFCMCGSKTGTPKFILSCTNAPGRNWSSTPRILLVLRAAVSHYCLLRQAAVCPGRLSGQFPLQLGQACKSTIDLQWQVQSWISRTLFQGCSNTHNTHLNNQCCCCCDVSMTSLILYCTATQRSCTIRRSIVSTAFL